MEYAELSSAQQEGIVLAASSALEWFGVFGDNVTTTMIAIAGAESNYNPAAAGDMPSQISSQYQDLCRQTNCNGYCSWGLWQIFMPLHADTIVSIGGPDPNEDPCATANFLSDPDNNAKMAFLIWENIELAGGNGFTAWSTWKNGSYEKYLVAAGQALEIVKSQKTTGRFALKSTIGYIALGITVGVIAGLALS